MKPTFSLLRTALVTGFFLSAASLPLPALADSAQKLNSDAKAAIQSLVKNNPKAKAIRDKAIAVLVFPTVTKAGLGIGGQYGEGVLYLKGGKVGGYYSTAGASVGLQAGAQVYGYVMFFLSRKTLDYLDASAGFEVGVGPSVVVGDDGVGNSTTTTTAQDAIYAFIFDQKGAMAALGIQGNKITKIDKK